MRLVHAEKLKLLYLLDILKKSSDEEHPISMSELINRLEENGISAERKSIGRDLNALEEFGYEINRYEENKAGYYLMTRDFDESELRFLIDAVLSSRCITAKKSRELIGKLEGQTSRFSANKLRRNRDINERIKCSNEEFYYNIDKISLAISEDRKINFQYYHYNKDRQKVLRRKGYIYPLSPYDLVWNEDFYYVIGLDDKHEGFTHYRIDRMHCINITGDSRRRMSGLENVGHQMNTSTYMKKTFRMFGGECTKVDIRFTKDLMNVIIDRFGEDAMIMPQDKEHFMLHTEVHAGEGFLSWMLQFGNKAQLIYPEELRDKLFKKIEKMREEYIELK